jgi:hypothetical protein
MQLHPADAAFLAAQLAGGRWTYVAFAEESKREVVRINSISGVNAAIVRARDATTAQAWAIGDCFSSVLGPSAVLDIANQAAVNTSLSITGTGAATVTQPTPRNFIVNVPPVTLTACQNSAIEVLGTYPNFQICLNRTALVANCSGTWSGPSESAYLSLEDGNLIIGDGATQVSYDPDTGKYLVSTPQVSITGGTDITVSGTFPNFIISYSGTPGGSGTVTSVSAGPGLQLTGTPNISPTLSLTTTGVTVGNYAGMDVDAHGRITVMPVPPGPNSGPIMVTDLHSGLETINSLQLTRTGHAVTFRVMPASTAVDGWGVVRLAPPTAVDSRTPSDAERVVTPAGLDAVLAAFEGGITAALVGSSSGESSSLYSVTAAATTVNVPAGHALLVFATATAVSSANPTADVGQFGIAIFHNATFTAGTRIVPGNVHTLMAKITATGAVALELKHTPLPVGFSLSTGQLSYIVVKA